MMTVTEFFSYQQAFLTSLRREGLAPTTCKAYGDDLQRLSATLAPYQYEPLRRELFVFALKQLSFHQAHPRSIARHLSSWRRYQHFLLKNQFINEDFLQGIKAPKPPSRLPKALDAEELNTLLNQPHLAQEDFFSRRDRALCELLYATGMRIAEAAQLDCDDIDWQQEQVRVFGKGSRERIIPLTKHSMAALQKYLALRPQPQNEKALFVSRTGRRLSKRRLQQCIEAALQPAANNRHISPHMLRHSYASHLLESSGNIRAVQELLGHAGLNTTQIYTKLDFDHLAAVYDQAHPRAHRTDQQDDD